MDAGLHLGAFQPRGEARAADDIDADVAQPAATHAGLVADVGGVAVVVGEGAVDALQPPERALGEQLAHALPLRGVQDHEGSGASTPAASRAAISRPKSAACIALRLHSTCSGFGSGR